MERDTTVDAAHEALGDDAGECITELRASAMPLSQPVRLKGARKGSAGVAHEATHENPKWRFDSYLARCLQRIANAGMLAILLRMKRSCRRGMTL